MTDTYRNLLGDWAPERQQVQKEDTEGICGYFQGISVSIQGLWFSILLCLSDFQKAETGNELGQLQVWVKRRQTSSVIQDAGSEVPMSAWQRAEGRGS